MVARGFHRSAPGESWEVGDTLIGDGEAGLWEWIPDKGCS